MSDLKDLFKNTAKSNEPEQSNLDHLSTITEVIGTDLLRALDMLLPQYSSNNRIEDAACKLHEQLSESLDQVSSFMDVVNEYRENVQTLEQVAK